ncbi:hypothetical protein LR48_Vigan10g260500 [Vigna angularis]|uniref:Uncharacterized protein n=1 Tax=Phaseolus angularis TaxID=3914 RepID=A0A0L9VP27_PHAAN|nr:hypothetical protein LR48_Vigan10g260500 [Vigna angularis]
MAGSKEHFTPNSRSKNTDSSLGAWEATADGRRRASSLRRVSRPCWKKIHGQLKITKNSCNVRRPWLNGMEKGVHNKEKKAANGTASLEVHGNEDGGSCIQQRGEWLDV